RAAQVLGWVYRQGVIDPQHMTNLPQADRQTLSQRLRFTTARIVRHQIATDGTQKLLMDWRPEPASPPQQALPVLSEPSSRGQTECVMIPALRGRERRTACVSSQIGCPVGCRFCASGLDGLEGNLTAGQIVEQVWRLGQLPDAGRITHVVFMGMGEPLANFAQVTRAIRMLMADWGLGISGRRITLSTVGLPAQIRRLADLNLPITLAISLHAPDDDLRRRLIPWAQHVSIQQIIDAGRYYFDRTSREVTLEYILLRNVNDRPQHARQLAQVARLLRSNVNLIRYNEVRSLPFDRPTADDVRRFQQTLRQAGVNVHIRASRGRDIAAACGQLRHQTAGR
ncbi:MAG TPA: 23S rRNA (adenine(2503)-C(2))-methyltransferase RlmN, partial [Phycisphaeraceae bacterium]